MITIDGSRGEGGGQVVRSALALSMVTGRPLRIHAIRAGRKKPGLARQHLTAVEAAARISGAHVVGAELGAQELRFEPGPIVPGEHRFAVGTAGSTTLVAQTVLPALLTASAPSTLVLEGGTHNPLAPPFEFLERAYLPLIERMGPRVEARLERHGFYPAGGGRFVLEIEPCAHLEGFELPARGRLQKRRARAIVANLPRHIAERELRELARKLGWEARWCEAVEAESPGPGNALVVELEHEHLCEVFCGFGEVRLPAEKVAARTAAEVKRYLAVDVAVGEHLADQLLLPLALAGRGAYTTLPLSRHATTQIELIGQFLEVEIKTEELGEGRVLVRVG